MGASHCELSMCDVYDEEELEEMRQLEKIKRVPKEKRTEPILVQVTARE
jgi:hypothetical protein